MTNFDKWDKEFRDQNLYAFNCDWNGLLWLKVRAICRIGQIGQFVADNGISLVSRKVAEQGRELFARLETMPEAMGMLDSYLNEKSHEWYSQKGVDEGKLKEDLYKVRHYEWGGDRNNSLDKHLVSRYVKTVCDYDDLTDKRAEIASNAWNYVQTSWYNNWTSYLIEAMFKRHEKVTPAVGEIKSVDFFVADVPIDLKVTYFPSMYMEDKLSGKLGCKELTWLRSKAKDAGITVDNAMPKQLQMDILGDKLAEVGRADITDMLKAKRKEVVDEARSNPMELMMWLYSHQGEMRFGAENRMFLMLVDTTDMVQSWKMKRAFPLIESRVRAYLDGFGEATFLKEVSFEYKGKKYRSLADIIFVVR